MAQADQPRMHSEFFEPFAAVRSAQIDPADDPADARMLPAQRQEPARLLQAVLRLHGDAAVVRLRITEHVRAGEKVVPQDRHRVVDPRM
jgi:hypothetical protein